MKFTTERKPDSTALVSYSVGVDQEIQNIYTDYSIESTDSLRYIQSAAAEWILSNVDEDGYYKANLAILRSAHPEVLIPGWSYSFAVVSLDEDEDEEEEDEEDDDWEEEEEEGEE